MKIPKAAALLFLCLTILFGCSNETIQSLPISQKATEIENLINQTKWDRAEQEAALIEELYKSNEWKYQLYGDETEYNNFRKLGLSPNLNGESLSCTYAVRKDLRIYTFLTAK